MRVQLSHEQYRSFAPDGTVLETKVTLAGPIKQDYSIEGRGISIVLDDGGTDGVGRELVISEAQLVELGYIPALAPLEEVDDYCELCDGPYVGEPEPTFNDYL